MSRSKSDDHLLKFKVKVKVEKSQGPSQTKVRGQVKCQV